MRFCNCLILAAGDINDIVMNGSLMTVEIADILSDTALVAVDILLLFSNTFIADGNG